MLVAPWIVNLEVKDIGLNVIDHDHSTYSGKLIQKIGSSGYFRITDLSGSYAEAMQSIQSNESDIILEIKLGFESDLLKEGSTQVLIAANAVNGTKGGLGSNYLAQIINEYSTEIRENFQPLPNTAIPVIDVVPQNRFNPHLDYKVFIVPAQMVLLLTILCGFLPALNIVGEKETGTIEQINVTPVVKFTFIIAKLIPYWIIGFVVLSLCFVIAALVYGIVPTGSLLTVYLFAGLFVLSYSGIGLVVSNYSGTMQQAMFVMFFFTIILILMSGMFTPVNNMPQWAQIVTIFNPLKYFIQVMHLVYLKGSGVWALCSQFIALLGFAVFFNTWAILSYRKKA
jgi:ABC-2 type transport system permease protein